MGGARGLTRITPDHLGPSREFAVFLDAFWNGKNEPGSAPEAPKRPQGSQNGAKIPPKRSPGTCFFGNGRKCDFEQHSYEKALLLRFAGVWKVTKMSKKSDAERGAAKKQKNAARDGPGRIFKDFGLQKGAQNVPT